MQKALYERYAAKLLLVCLRYTQHKADAEDILQEGFLKIFNNIHQFNFKGNFEGWLRIIVVNTALEHIRKNKISFTDIDIFETEIIESNNYNALSNMQLKELLELIQQLPDGCKIIFNLYVFEQHTHKEIAEKLNVSEGTSKSQLARARQLLQDKMEQQNNNNNKHTKLDVRKEYLR